MSTNLLPRPKSYEEAQSEFQRVMGDPRRLNKYLVVAITVMSLTCIAMVAMCLRLTTQQKEKIVVRIDDVGRALAVGFTTSGYKAQPNEVKYFLSQFVHDYYGRNRATVREDFARSMYFLNSPLAVARMDDDRKNKAIEKFILGGDDEIDIQVNNIILSEITKAPYSAQVDIEKVYRNRGGIPTRREKYVVSISFTIAAEVPNAAVLVNPLGFTVLDLRVDQAF